METSATTSNDAGNKSPNSQSTSTDSFNMSNIKDAAPKDEKNSLKTNSDAEDEEFVDAEDDGSESDEELDVDEEELANLHKDLTEDELLKQKSEAVNLKTAGNECFKAANHKEAVILYTRALNICPLKYKNDRSILYANRAAARIGLEKKDEALLDCNKAIELNPDYLRAILRRAQLHRKMDSLERCLEDYKRILELDKENMEARQACATLPAEINERNEKMKEEMLGKLKELGNICLKPFGLSTENFKMVQDPNTGGYSVNFQK